MSSRENHVSCKHTDAHMETQPGRGIGAIFDLNTLVEQGNKFAAKGATKLGTNESFDKARTGVCLDV